MMQIEDHIHYKSADLMWKIISPVLIAFGSFGSVVTVIVLSREKPKKSATAMYLMALAFSDFLALNTGLLRQWIKYTFGIDIREDVSESGCKFHFFIVYAVTQFSSWMLICVTMERVLSTWLPHRRRIMCSTKSALGLIIATAFVLLLLNSHYLYGYGDLEMVNGNETTITKCHPLNPAYDHFIQYDWVWIDLCVFYLIPIFVLLVGNCAIIYKVIDSHRRSKRTVAPSTAQKGNELQSKQISQLTVTLMILSLVFFICITPIVVYPIGEPYWKKGASAEHLAFLFWWETFANLMMYINHSINCVLYYLSGTKFRKEVQKLFCRRKVHVTETSLQAANTNSFRIPGNKNNER